MRPASLRGSAPRRRVYAACVAGLAAAALTASACDSNKGLDPATNVPSEVSSSGGTSASESMNPHTTAPTPMTSSRASSTDASKTDTPSSSSTSTRTTAASVSPPHSSTHTTAPSPKPTLSSKDRRNAETALHAYNQVVDYVSHDPPSTWRASLSRVAGPTVVNAALGTLTQVHAHGLVSYGTTYTQIISIDPGQQSRSAVIKICEDSSKNGLVYPDGTKYTVGRKGVYDEVHVAVVGASWKVVYGPKPRRKNC